MQRPSLCRRLFFFQEKKRGKSLKSNQHNKIACKGRHTCFGWKGNIDSGVKDGRNKDTVSGRSLQPKQHPAREQAKTPAIMLLHLPKVTTLFDRYLPVSGSVVFLTASV
jgi:hypothetical protein